MASGRRQAPDMRAEAIAWLREGRIRRGLPADADISDEAARRVASLLADALADREQEQAERRSAGRSRRSPT